jgi:hypothetical protein
VQRFGEGKGNAKIPIGTEIEEKEVHHYTEKIKISRPVFMEIPDFLICLGVAILLVLVWHKAEPPSPTQPTINIHIENNAQK